VHRFQDITTYFSKFKEVMREPEHMGNVSCGEPSLNEYSAAPTDGGDDDDDDDDDGEN